MMNSTSHTFNFNRQWIVRHNPIFRLLDKKEYLDSFFETGEIQLGCFAIFKKYPDEIQGDKKEGQAMLYANTTEGKTIGAYFNSASNALVLSTTKNINERVISEFNAIGAIKIKNPTAFAVEISNRIPFFVAGTEGNCIYQKDRLIKRELTEEQTKKYSLNKMNVLENQFQLINEVSNNDEAFIKIDKYSYQSEYRIAWFTRNNQTEHLIVKCPEVIQFCERIDF